MPLMTIDESLCTACGECVNDCVRSLISLEGDIPSVAPDKEEQCFDCRHCLAVCPTGALSLSRMDPESCTPLEGALPTGEQMSALIRGRRSVRRCAPEPLDRAFIDSMLATASHAPTGVNNLSTLLTVVYAAAVMDRIRNATMEAIRKAADKGTLPPGMEFFQGILSAWDKGVDVIFRGAPHLIVTSSTAQGPSPDADCFIFLSYFELLAQSMGVGTLWNGLFKWAFTSIAPEVVRLLNIPDEHKVGYAMIFGIPTVQYQRTVERPTLAVNEVLA